MLVIPDVTGSILSLRYPVSMQDRTLFFFFFFFFLLRRTVLGVLVIPDVTDSFLSLMT